MKEKWFRRKTYGWGWTPARWQGWAVVFGFVICLGYVAHRYPPAEGPANFLQTVILLVAVLLLICYKTGEPPRWSFGK
ncbi:MAG: hypothetical protein OXR66_00010 [Candidatus Woesearchaeota archaeon]|nr:hypothetical protein [Candidatus Woesearchaeota archaeon]